MNTYCHIDLNGLCIGVYHTNDDAFEPPTDYVITSGASRAWIGTKQWNGNAWNDYEPPVRIITRADFTERFTSLELESILSLAKTNVKAEAFIRFVMVEDQINLDSERIWTALDQMTTAGILTAGRKEEVLA